MTLAIIGAGPSGLVSAAAALKNKLVPTVFEKGASIGGLWKPVGGSVWDSMRTNLSHHHCMFSDFPWSSHTPDFPSHQHVYDYLCRYAEHHKISPHLRLHTPVQRVQQHDSKWSVEWKENNQLFDHVIIATGIFSKAFIPSIPGLDTFKGTVLHTQHYKNPQPFAHQQVLVIGNAQSGTEIAAELSHVADKVMHVTKRDMWVVPRYISTTPWNLVERPAMTTNRSKNEWYRSITKQDDIPLSGLPPFVSVSDIYLSQIKSQKIERLPPIKEIQGNNVILDNGKREIDSIIFATGYQASLPFFSDTLLKKLEFDHTDRLQPLLLHKSTFHPQLPHLGFVGMYKGPHFNVMELQARWITDVFSGKITPPTDEQMKQGIEEERQIRNRTPRPQSPRSHASFAESLSNELKDRPNFGQKP